MRFRRRPAPKFCPSCGQPVSLAEFRDFERRYDPMTGADRTRRRKANACPDWEPHGPPHYSDASFSWRNVVTVGQTPLPSSGMRCASCGYDPDDGHTAWCSLPGYVGLTVADAPDPEPPADELPPEPDPALLAEPGSVWSTALAKAKEAG